MVFGRRNPIFYETQFKISEKCNSYRISIYKDSIFKGWFLVQENFYRGVKLYYVLNII